MLKNIFNTISFRLVTQLLGMVILFMTADVLGIGGKGEKSIFVANLSLVILLNGFIGSSVIVYLTPKTNFYKLLIPSYIWALASSLISPLLLSFLFSWVAEFYNTSPEDLDLHSTNYYLYLVVASFLGSVFEFHSMVLLGKQKIKSANVLSLIKVLVILIVLVVSFFVLSYHEAESYFIAINIAYIIGTSISVFLLLRLKEPFDLSNMSETLKRLVKLGFVDQFANVIQFLNKRLPYYPLFLLFGEGDVGILSVGVSLTEAILFLPQSVSTVQYSKISNSNDKKYNINISAKMFRFSFVILVMGLLGLIAIPFYSLFLENTFDQVQEVIALLTLGIISIGSSSIFNHYFSGIGKFEENVYSNLLGLVATIFVGCLYLIPKFGIYGAALSSSLSYTVIAIYLSLSFKFRTKTSFKELIPSKQDFYDFICLINNQLKKRMS